MSKKKWHIYVLIDPITDQVRYVGWTSNPKQRIKNHIARSKHENHHRANWIKSLLKKEVLPKMMIIETGKGLGYAERESFWISYYRSIGCDLTNSTNGGEGTIGYSHSENTKEKIRIGNTGKKMSSASIEKTRIANIGNKHSLGRKPTPSHIDKLRTSRVRPVIRVEDEMIFGSVKEAALSIGKAHSGICIAIKTGIKCGGYHWEYLP